MRSGFTNEPFPNTDRSHDAADSGLDKRNTAWHWKTSPIPMQSPGHCTCTTTWAARCFLPSIDIEKSENSSKRVLPGAFLRYCPRSEGGPTGYRHPQCGGLNAQFWFIHYSPEPMMRRHGNCAAACCTIFHRLTAPRRHACRGLRGDETEEGAPRRP